MSTKTLNRVAVVAPDALERTGELDRLKQAAARSLRQTREQQACQGLSDEQLQNLPAIREKLSVIRERANALENFLNTLPLTEGNDASRSELRNIQRIAESALKSLGGGEGE